MDDKMKSAVMAAVLGFNFTVMIYVGLAMTLGWSIWLSIPAGLVVGGIAFGVARAMG